MILTVNQYAQKVGLKRDTIYKQIKKETLKFGKLKIIAGKKFIEWK